MEREKIKLNNNETIEIQTPYGNLILSTFDKTQEGIKDCVKVNAVFKNISINPLASNMFVIKLNDY